jgi:hypothetical protein
MSGPLVGGDFGAVLSASGGARPGRSPAPPDVLNSIANIFFIIFKIKNNELYNICDT